VVDSLETRLSSDSKRKMLVKESKKTTKRYKGSDLKVRAGIGAGTMIATGTAIAVLGIGVATSAVGAFGVAMFSGASATAVSTALLPSTIVLFAPVLVVGGIFRGANNSKVSGSLFGSQSRISKYTRHLFVRS
jgi:type IV secretory pathway TrbD component